MKYFALMMTLVFLLGPCWSEDVTMKISKIQFLKSRSTKPTYIVLSVKLFNDSQSDIYIKREFQPITIRSMSNDIKLVEMGESIGDNIVFPLGAKHNLELNKIFRIDDAERKDMDPDVIEFYGTYFVKNTEGVMVDNLLKCSVEFGKLTEGVDILIPEMSK